MRLHGLIEKTPRTNTYTVTAEGIRVAVFYTKLQARLLEPLLEADKPPAPLELRRASARSNACSATMSRTRASDSQLETCHKIQRLVHQEDLDPVVHRNVFNRAVAVLTERV